MIAPEIIERERMRAVEVWREMSSMPIPIGGYEPIIQRYLLEARAEQIRPLVAYMAHAQKPEAEGGCYPSCSRCLWEALATALEAAAKETR